MIGNRRQYRTPTSIVHLWTASGRIRRGPDWVAFKIQTDAENKLMFATSVSVFFSVLPISSVLFKNNLNLDQDGLSHTHTVLLSDALVVLPHEILCLYLGALSKEPI